MSAQRKVIDVLYREDFRAFVAAAFAALYPGQVYDHNWHIDHIAFSIQEMVTGCARNRLVLNLPPRKLKSFVASVCLPAWLLGRDPSERIMCASYSESLSHKFSRDCRALMETQFYKRIFPRTRLNPKKITEQEFETTRRGYRLATSVNGTLTGRGGSILIVDDPMKADDANSEVALSNTTNWFQGTAVSRLDEPQKGMIIVVMQRLHIDDLSGVLIEQGWPHKVLPAIAEEEGEYAIGKKKFYRRAAGELLHPTRDSLIALKEIRKEQGSRHFSTQYQQNPTPADGNMIKRVWLTRFDLRTPLPKFQRIVLSCDPAGKPGPRNDYTAITVVGVDRKEVRLLHAARGRWTIQQMLQRIVKLVAEWRVDLSLIEDTSTGMGLIQLLKEQPGVNVIGRRPKDDKQTRMLRHQGRFEASRVMFPNEASWLAEFENELLQFPHGKYDDQVDSFIQFLDWYAEVYKNLNMTFAAPIIVPLNSPSTEAEYLDAYRRGLGLAPF
jgi:predicted phage terminase large subunit-like protein